MAGGGRWTSLPADAVPWQVATRAVAWTLPAGKDKGLPELTFVTLVVAADAKVRALHLTQRAPPTDARLAALVREGARRPPSGLPPRRPTVVHVEDPDRVAGLGRRLAEQGAEVRLGDVGRAQDAFDDFETRGPPGRSGPVWWLLQDPQTIDAYFEAADAFLAAAPWERLASDACAAVRIGQGDWSYVCVMGQNPEPDRHPGVAVYGDWAHLEAILAADLDDASARRRQESADALLAATGGMEAVTFVPVWSLHPRDAQRLYALGKLRSSGIDVFLPHRWTARGPAPPSRTLRQFTTILSALTACFTARNLAKALPRDGEPHAWRIPVVDAEVEVRFPVRGPQGAGGAQET